MSNIWLDISTIYGWSRPAVGIVKTEAECALCALQDYASRVRFCKYDPTQGYQEVLRSDVYIALERVLGNRAFQSLSNTKAVQQEVAGFLTSNAEKSAVVSPEKITSNSERLRLVPRKRGTPFESGDVYISMGLDWDQKDLIFLYEQKRAIGFKIILFCYDLIPVKLPHLCVGEVAALFSKYFVNLVWCADKILCISECSRNDLQTFLKGLGTPTPVMDIVKLGTEVGAIDANACAEDVLDVLKHSYILFVSTIERRKNHETIYHAYTRLIEQGLKDLPQLVFVGMPGWGVNDFMSDLRLDPRVNNRIKVLNHVNASDLAMLYRQAYFTIFPSLYEGWGLPVGESLAFGKFCLCSSAASIPEVGGDLLEYLDPRDVPMWATRMAWYIEHPEEITRREQKIKNEYLPISWTETSKYVISAAMDLVGTKSGAKKGHPANHYANTPWLRLVSSLRPGIYSLEVPSLFPSGDYFLEVVENSDVEVSMAGKSIAAREQELQQLDREIMARSGALLEACTALASTQTQLQAVYSSWSWKITSPLRAAARPLVNALRSRIISERVHE